MDLTTAAWRKSPLSGTNGCVEVAFVGGQVAVRDSKNRDSILVFTPTEWRAFVGATREGYFDLPEKTG